MDAATSTVLEGQLERVTYTREDTGYTVAQVRASGYAQPVTVVGILAAPTVGEHIRMTGMWVAHPRFGRQFQIQACVSEQPTTGEGIEKYLSSGLIPGLGPVTASRIVKHFGERTLDIIAADPGRLAEIPGIGEKRIASITKAWNDQRSTRDVMVFLSAHDVSTNFALRIVKRYGERAAAVIRSNPYRLAADIHGIGFQKADRIAASLGIAPDSPVRVQAGLVFVLEKEADDGHVYCPRERLTARVGELLGVSPERVDGAVSAAVRDRQIVLEPGDGGDAVFLARFHHCETAIASHLTALIRAPRAKTVATPERAIQWVAGRLRFTLSEGQRLAVMTALEQTVAVITGGPGTGKTTIVRAIVEIYRRAGARVMLGAPTGRAAKRLSEATGLAAGTIHRLLEYSPQKGGFQRTRQRPLSADVMIVDEASMLDTVIMYFLLSAVPSGCVFVMVGDIHQLPSVGAGNVLGDIIDSGRVAVARLSDIFRQSEQSRIVVNAHRIHSGRMPVTDAAEDLSDFYFIEQEDPAVALELILKLVADRIPGRFGLDPVDDIQVITPMHKGLVGAAHLNLALQQALNPRNDGVAKGEGRLCIGDKVMQIRNNYDKDVFNGDMGRISAIDEGARQIRVLFDGQTVVYDGGDLDDITLAYAVSVHKAQGSEYPAVVIPLLTQHYVMLQRNLIYTAVTRGRQLVVLVGSRRAVKIGIGKIGVDTRFTRLRERLREAGMS
ncbi:MAG: ATP-dependent RecD-like DNA helicase [Pseudomonadota bacterium]